MAGAGSRRNSNRGKISEAPACIPKIAQSTGQLDPYGLRGSPEGWRNNGRGHLKDRRPWN